MRMMIYACMRRVKQECCDSRPHALYLLLGWKSCSCSQAVHPQINTKEFRSGLLLKSLVSNAEDCLVCSKVLDVHQ